MPQTAISQVSLLRRLGLHCQADVSRNLGFSLRHVALAATSQPTYSWAGSLPSGLHWVCGQPLTNDGARINNLTIASVQPPCFIMQTPLSMGDRCSHLSTSCVRICHRYHWYTAETCGTITSRKPYRSCARRASRLW